MALAKMRTIKGAVSEIKANDPESAISEYYLRSLVKQNKIPVFKSGTKFLINFDTLIEFLSKQETEEEPIIKEYGVIRRVGD